MKLGKYCLENTVVSHPDIFKPVFLKDDASNERDFILSFRCISSRLQNHPHFERETHRNISSFPNSIPHFRAFTSLISNAPTLLSTVIITTFHGAEIHIPRINRVRAFGQSRGKNREPGTSPIKAVATGSLIINITKRSELSLSSAHALNRTCVWHRL